MDVVDVVLNNEMYWDDRWIEHYQKYALSFRFKPSYAREIRTQLAEGKVVPMQQGNDCYEIRFNENTAGILTVTPYPDDKSSAEINVTTFEEYRGHHLAEIAIKRVLKETKYSIIVGFVYNDSPCKVVMNYIFDKLGFISKLDAGGIEWSKEVLHTS